VSLGCLGKKFNIWNKLKFWEVNSLTNFYLTSSFKGMNYVIKRGTAKIYIYIFLETVVTQSLNTAT
jgi:hypothetical protein